jgi:hypothetical protein
MAKFSSPVTKAPSSKPFSLPKLPQGKPMSAGNAGRSSASGYGKVSKASGGGTSIPMQVQNHPALKGS